MRALLTTLALVITALPTPLSGSAGAGDVEARTRAATPTFRADTKRITGQVRERITGSSWRRGCPVPRSKLRLIRATHWDFQRELEQGALIVHKRHKRRIVGVLRDLFEARFPIRKMNLIDRYGADDQRSMSADNTSGFNCRYVNGTTRWSMHAYGKAIDVNPIENPYVTSSGYVSPAAGEPYADRSRHAEGMIHRGDEAYDAFNGIGWRWGGDWPDTKDYQHFSSNGR